MVEFVTIKAEEIKFGDGKFLEVAKKKAISEDGENVFVSLSRGFFTPEGERRYRKSFTIPLEKEVIDFVAAKVPEVFTAEGDAEPAKEEAKEEAPKKEAPKKDKE